MERTARALAGYGRHGDNNLLHVSDQELRGIELLTGKKFTRNPDTGLPEAFNWSSLIPIAAGVAGTALGGPLGGALASGVTSAGITAAQGGSAEQALTKGLISGVTSYAGGQLLSGVGSAAGETTAAAAQGATQGAAQGGTEAATQAASALNPMASNAAYAGAESVGQAAGYQGALGPATGIEGNLAAAGEGGMQLGSRLSNIASDPGAAFSKLSENVSNNKMAALLTAGGAYTTAMDAMGPPKIPGETPYDPSRWPEKFPENPRTWNAPSSDYQPGYSPEYRYFAKGGLTDLRKDDGVTSNVMNEAKAALLGEHPRPGEALGRFKNMFGEDALGLLKDRVTGGRVRGAGGGMDDLIPGTIEGRQQVRLADGEFVIPADVVSGLGDGSTDQGVRRLHEMMSKVRHQRTGKTAQPKAIGGKISL